MVLEQELIQEVENIETKSESNKKALLVEIYQTSCQLLIEIINSDSSNSPNPSGDYSVLLAILINNFYTNDSSVYSKMIKKF